MTKERLRNQVKPLVVCREKVCQALVWLKDNNPLYKDVEISEQNLDSLPLEDVLPYHIENVADSEARETLVSRYDGLEGQPSPDVSSTHLRALLLLMSTHAHL